MNHHEERTVTPEGGNTAPNVHLVLKEEVEATFGRRILTARDCQLLSEQIYNKTATALNYNTLRRFFGIVRSAYPPSAATLTILANYCGFESPADLASYKGKQRRRLNDDEQSMTRFLSGLFQNTPTRNANDETFLAVVRHAINYVNDHPAIADKLQRAIARTANGQTYYFEQFINIDKLNSHYGTGLLYYAAEKKTPEAKIFVHALLCQLGWATKQAEAVTAHYREVVSVPLTSDLHPFVGGRYFATRLFHADTLNLPVEDILAEAAAYHQGLPKSGDNYRFFPCFEYVIAIALTLTGHYSEAKHYLDYAATAYTATHTYLDKGFYQTLDICRGLTLVGLGKKEEALRVFERLRPEEFYFLTKKTNTIQYLVLARELNQPISDIDGQVEALVQETGFVRMKELFRKGKEGVGIKKALYSLVMSAGANGFWEAEAFLSFGF